MKKGVLGEQEMAPPQCRRKKGGEKRERKKWASFSTFVFHHLAVVKTPLSNALDQRQAKDLERTVLFSVQLTLDHRKITRDSYKISV